MTPVRHAPLSLISSFSLGLLAGSLVVASIRGWSFSTFAADFWSGAPFSVGLFLLGWYLSPGECRRVRPGGRWFAFAFTFFGGGASLFLAFIPYDLVRGACAAASPFALGFVLPVFLGMLSRIRDR